MGLTPAGSAFLKVATCPCDFSIGATGFVGIPDEYDGPVVTDNQSLVTTFSPTSANDNYILLLPTPGVAYWYGHRASGTTNAITFTAALYDDSSNLYGTWDDANVTAFRYASNAIELVNVTNSMTWSGSIEAWKTTITEGALTDTFVSSHSLTLPLGAPILEGFDSLSSLRPEAVMPIKDGIYGAAFNAQATYPFTPIKENMTYVELSASQEHADGDEALVTFTCPSIDYLGCGSIESIIIKIPAAAASQQLMLRTWSTLEFQVPRNSILFNFTHFSPPFDPQALAVLHAHHRSHKGFVTARENATFWKNVLLWMRRASTIASYMPGPIGTVGGLTREILNVVDSSKGHELW